ncbi:MAG: hypothetical protein JEZ06_05770 [Anaerolineaceae bacterium]|nr:hypothetical protein [Anaerolineaceae bacterium]
MNMQKRQHLSKEKLNILIQSENIKELSYPEIINYFQAEKEYAKSVPDNIFQIDPRNDERILFSSSRAKRPHDNQPKKNTDLKSNNMCVICEGNTTKILDYALLSEGFTFINKNLFPAVYPEINPVEIESADSLYTNGFPVHGLHFLQWTSSFHDQDWHTMPIQDLEIVMQRLSFLEKHLLISSSDYLTGLKTSEKEGTIDQYNINPGKYPGYVSIIKNVGRLVGGSLSHGHQQIVFSNTIPRRILDNWRFEKEHGEYFSTFLLRENPSSLMIKEYPHAVLVVPYFMRRPYDMILILKDTHKQYMHELSAGEINSIAQGWHDALLSIHRIMPQIGREIAFNVVTHNGPGAGLYFEFLPYTQETGGFEHLGLFICHANPQLTASNIRNSLAII